MTSEISAILVQHLHRSLLLNGFVMKLAGLQGNALRISLLRAASRIILMGSLVCNTQLQSLVFSEFRSLLTRSTSVEVHFQLLCQQVVVFQPKFWPLEKELSRPKNYLSAWLSGQMIFWPNFA